MGEYQVDNQAVDSGPQVVHEPANDNASSHAYSTVCPVARSECSQFPWNSCYLCSKFVQQVL